MKTSRWCKFFLAAMLVLPVYTLQAGVPENYVLNTEYASPNRDTRVRILVFGTTETATTKDALDTFMKFDINAGKSAHYVVSDTVDPAYGKVTVYNTVPEEACAWSSGVSACGSRKNVNPSSIGIWSQHRSFSSPGDSASNPNPWPEEQVAALAELAKKAITERDIKPQHVVSYADVTATRDSFAKILLPWQTLYENYGVGAWPDRTTVEAIMQDESATRIETPEEIKQLQKNLRSWGYTGVTVTGLLDKMTTNALIAFQLHFRQSKFDGTPDAETVAILQALIDKYLSGPK